MSSCLLSVSLLELLKLWGELVEVYHGKHGYGGDAAEIYAYRLTQYNPTIHLDANERFKETTLYKDAQEFATWKTGKALQELCDIFASVYDCTVLINGALPQTWFEYGGSRSFEHRVTITIKHEPRLGYKR